MIERLDAPLPAREGPIAPACRSAAERGWPVMVLWLALFMSPGWSAAADDGMATDARFLAGLRSRQLDRLAEAYCEQRMARDDLSDERRARLAVELSRTLVTRALGAPPEQRAALWQRAEQAAQSFDQQHPHSPWTTLTKVQAALVLVARGELARQISAFQGDGRSRLGEAREDFRAAIRRLEAEHQAIEIQLRRGAAAPRLKSGSVTSRDLESLDRHVRFELARALTYQGQCFPPQSPDRTAALERAVRRLRPLAELSTVDPLAWQSRIELVRCLRLLEDHGAAIKRLDRLDAQSPPAAIQLLARAERIRLLLATGAVNPAARLASQRRSIDGQTSAELDMAALEAFLTVWKKAHEAGQKNQAARQRKAVETLVTQMARRHGAYWGRRAESLMARSISTWSRTGDVELLVRMADSYYRAEQWDQALAAYDRAQQQATARGDSRRAFQIGYVAAGIEHQRKHHRQAARRFARLTLEFPQDERAAEAHLLAIYHAGQRLRDAKDKAAMKAYVSLLKEHLDHWDSGPTADEAHWRLARVYDAGKQYARAVEQYRAISRDSPRFATTPDRLAEIWRAWLNLGGADRTATAAEAAHWFDRLVLDAKGKPPKTWTAKTRTAALTAARFRVEFLGGELDRAEQLLTAAIDAPDTPEAWRQRALPWLALTLVAQGRSHEAAKLVEQLSAGNLDAMLAMLDRMSRMPRPAEVQPRRDIASIEARAAEMVLDRDAELDERGRRLAETVLAAALAEAGRADEADLQYKRLRQQYPRDARLLEQHAALLLSRGDAQSQRRALQAWRELERHSRTGSQLWFRAKYGLCAALLALGNRTQAEKILSLTEVLHPDLGGPVMKAQFIDLFRKTRRE